MPGERVYMFVQEGPRGPPVAAVTVTENREAAKSSR